jgi:hypothetical protein
VVGATVLAIDNENDLIEIQKQVWINLLRDKVTAEHPARLGAVFYDDLTGIPDDTVALMRYCGSLEGATVTDNGTTTAFSPVLKAYNLSIWYMFKPADV